MLAKACGTFGERELNHLPSIETSHLQLEIKILLAVQRTIRLDYDDK